MARIPRIPDTILVAPDSFKGTFTAGQVASAIGRGLERAGRPVDLCPVADGGEGTLEALLEPLGGERVSVAVEDPLGREVEAEFGLVEEGRSGRIVAIVEMASASGLTLVDERDRDPIAASTFGTGELIAAAVAAGAELVYVGVGGSATTDGGAGALRAIARLGGLGVARLVVLCDVRTVFEEAARIYGPQKGAGPDDVKRLSRRLRDLARRLPRDPRGVAMTGAAGGLAGGLWAELGAELVPGAGFVLELLDFDDRMRSAHAVVTGEGRLDGQSLAGKAVAEVATRCRQSGVPCHAITGKRAMDAFDQRILDLQAILEATTLRGIEAAGRRLAGLV
jgi:glycerate kinase